MAFRKLARVEEIPPGKTRLVRAGKSPVILANWGGRIYALDGICPHQRLPLEGASVWDRLLECPWHHFQYDVRSGRNHYPRNVYPEDLAYLEGQVGPLKTYRVRVRGGDVWVDVG